MYRLNQNGKVGVILFFAFKVSVLCAQSETSSFVSSVQQFNLSFSPDSAVSRAHPEFDRVSKLHRIFFGENYRKEWSAETRLPLIRISEFRGGLVPVKQGGGNQTHSLRLRDKQGREWVMRSVEKNPENILPAVLRKTFIKDVLIDAMSAQHPYSALTVAPIAEAVGVPHANPMIGIVFPDTALGQYGQTFAGTICLLEEREPAGKSDNYFEMLEKLNEDNDNRFDSVSFLKARVLDVFLGDWDRHPDQWRFRPEKYQEGIRYTAIPRDRDQVFYTNQGVFPYFESRSYVQPFFEGFNPRIRNVGTLLFTSTMMNARLLNQFSYESWMRITSEFVVAVTDSVLDLAISRLPESIDKFRRGQLVRILKSRRADLPRAMSEYYYFLNKNVFIQTTNKSELVKITDTLGNAMQVNIFKISAKGGIKQPIFSKTYFPDHTKEIRFFIGGGNDSIFIDNKKTPVKLRFSGGAGIKRYQMAESNKKVSVFEKENGARFTGDTSRFGIHLSNDSNNTEIVPGNLFNVFTPGLDAGYNPDDGLSLGFTGRFTRGIDYRTTVFSTKKYTSYQQFGFVHSFSTRAYRAKYNAEWVHAAGKADILIRAEVYAPNNTRNFFGSGNQTGFNKSGDYRNYYRARFSMYTLNPSLRWKMKKEDYLSVGPAIEFYTCDSTDNTGRFIETPGAVQTYDSVTLSRSRLHGGLAFEFNRNRKEDDLLPTEGYTLHVRLQALARMNSYSKSFARLFADFAFYKAVDPNKTLVLADRVGAGMIIGNAAFYQSLFLGGQGNLSGYRQYRFAGQFMAYNNLEARVRLWQFANYLLPGQIGLIGLFDIGRVWQAVDHSNQWHNGVGGGIYFAPAQIALVELIISHSTEGWYPAFSIGFRF